LVRPRHSSDQLQRAQTLAADVGLSHASDALVSTLSHGEQRQLELGMALAGNPRLIMLDEPAAGLSPGERSRLTELLLALDPAITLLIIEHDMDVALRVAGVVTVMHDGAELATGTPHEILESKAVHDLYLGVANG
jgi:branched-chain amino acid transport system ATP-binding protein